MVLDYLAANPDAKDTARGIREWWLAKPGIEYSSTQVEAALAELVYERKLQAHVGADGQTIYSLVEKDQGGGTPP